MFCRPASFQSFLSANNNVGEIYEAMTSDDLSDVVIKALNVLKETKTIPLVQTTRKSESASTQFRIEGNDAYCKGFYQRALILYNKALLNAPVNSREMKLAYSNRSALFLKLNAYESCNIDIEKCFAMGCPTDIIEKLKKRKEDIKGLLVMEKMSRQLLKSVTYVNCNMKPHSQISCASSDVGIDRCTIPKIIAHTDIKIGAVIAMEKAYVSFTDLFNTFSTCHFCQKQSLNLVPCDGCCYALFCDENYRTECIAEYHQYECHILDYIRQICFGPMPNLIIKASIKMKMKSKSWNEFILASYKYGIDSIQSSSIKDIYDCNSPFSLLNIKDDKPFVHSTAYNASFVCAALIHYLQQDTMFFPQGGDERHQAVKAFGRVLLFLSIYQKPYFLVQGLTNFKIDSSYYSNVPNHGLFSFIGNMTNKCKPNLFTATVNNTLVLIATHSIKSGEELNVSYLQHAMHENLERHQRNLEIFKIHGTVCKCSSCIGNSPCNDQLSRSQKEYFSRLNMSEIDANLKQTRILNVYPTILNALEVLKDVPFSKEYDEVYQRFKQCILLFEVIEGENYVLDHLH